MNHKKTMEMLEEVYLLAKENKDPHACLRVIDMMILAGAAEAKK